MLSWRKSPQTGEVKIKVNREREGQREDTALEIKKKPKKKTKAFPEADSEATHSWGGEEEGEESEIEVDCVVDKPPSKEQPVDIILAGSFARPREQYARADVIAEETRQRFSRRI